MKIVRSVRRETRPGRPDSPIAIFVDGVQADPGIRFRSMLSVFDDCEIWFFRPTKERYCHASVTNIIGMAMEKAHPDSRFIIVGSSMGASNVWGVIQRFADEFTRTPASRQLLARIEKIVMVDPLYTGAADIPGVRTEIRMPIWLAKIPIALTRVRDADRRFSWLPAVMVGRDAKTHDEVARAHHAYSRSVSLGRWASEIGASLNVHQTWLPRNLPVALPPLRILYSKKDKVLTGKGVQRYRVAFELARRDADVKTREVLKTHHVGVAEQPDAWLAAFKWALTELRTILQEAITPRLLPGLIIWR